MFGKVFLYSSGEAFFLRYGHWCAFLYLCGKVFLSSLGEVFLSSPGEVFLSSNGEVFLSSHGEVGGGELSNLTGGGG